MFTNNLKNNATFVYENSWGYKVYMFLAQDHGTMRQSIGIIIESAAGNLSTPTYVKKSELIKGKDCFDFFFDLDGDFDKEDIDNIKAEAMQKLNKLKVVNLSSKSTIEKVYSELHEYANHYNGDGEVSITNGYFNIDTEAFEKILNKLNVGYKRLDVLKPFKLLGLMRINGGRCYDWMLTDANGNFNRVYSFILPPAVSGTSSTSANDEMYRGDIAC